jgi:hypothetical protein
MVILYKSLVMFGFLMVKASPDVLQRCCHLVPGTDISKVQPPGGCEYQHGCQVNKLLIYVCIVSDHEKKCGCIQEWMIDGAGLLTSLEDIRRCLNQARQVQPERSWEASPRLQLPVYNIAGVPHGIQPLPTV